MQCMVVACSRGLGFYDVTLILVVYLLVRFSLSGIIVH